AQPALYNGHEILKDNHAPAKVHNAEDTLEIGEITRKKMNAKMTDPECVTHKVKIAPYDYTKENLLATFTPQKQLTPEQIYWSNDLMKLKSKALKKRAKGIQKALTKEVKEMKDVFKELEAEHAVDVEPIVPHLRNNRDAHLDYLRHIKESVETIRDIVEEAKVPKSNPKTNRISPAKGANKLPVEDLPRTNKSHLRTSNRVDSSSRSRTDRPLVFGFRLLKTYDGRSLTALEFRKKVHRDSSIRE
nr:hypothetical protein [Tanacetum cinerariifolium]